ncbi:MAG: MFS transporter [Bacteroidota bacterium]
MQMPEVEQEPQKRKRLPIGLIFITALLDLLGLSLIVPVLGPLLISQNEILGPEFGPDSRNIVLGLIIGTFSLLQFFGSSILGSLSDKYGRKPVLVASLITSFVGYSTVGIGIHFGNLAVMFVGRAVQGFAAGNLAILFSSIADISAPEEKAKNFGLVGAAFGIGFVFGPLLGGVLSNPELVSWFTFTTPFIVGATLVLLNLLQVWVRFEETNEAPKPNLVVSPFAGFVNLGKAFSHDSLRSIFLVVFLQTFGFTFFTQMVQVTLIKQFDYGPDDIGYLYGFIGVVIALTQGVLVGIISKRYSPNKILYVTLFLLPVALLINMLPTENWQLFMLVPLIAICQGISTPNISAMISNMASKDEQGETLGMQQSVQALSQILPPLLGGFVVSKFITSPFWGAAFIIFLAWLAFIRQFKWE